MSDNRNDRNDDARNEFQRSVERLEKAVQGFVAATNEHVTNRAAEFVDDTAERLERELRSRRGQRDDGRRPLRFEAFAPRALSRSALGATQPASRGALAGGRGHAGVSHRAPVSGQTSPEDRRRLCGDCALLRRRGLGGARHGDHRSDLHAVGRDSGVHHRGVRVAESAERRGGERRRGRAEEPRRSFLAGARTRRAACRRDAVCAACRRISINSN